MAGIAFTKEKTLPKPKELKALQAPCWYTHNPPPPQLSANTIPAGCPGSLGAGFGKGTSREHLPISLQSHSALGQQHWCSEMLCRCLSHAKLLNNLWGKFPLVQKHTLQLKKHTLQLTRYHASLSAREAGVLYKFIQFTLFLSDKRVAASRQ